MGWQAPPLYGNKPSKFYEKKMAKAKKIIAKQEAIIAECELQIANNAKKASNDKA